LPTDRPTDPERDSDDENAGDEEAERREVADVQSSRVDAVRQRSERHEEQKHRAGNRLGDALRKHALVEEQVALSGRVQLRIM